MAGVVGNAERARDADGKREAYADDRRDEAVEQDGRLPERCDDHAAEHDEQRRGGESAECTAARRHCCVNAPNPMASTMGMNGMNTSPPIMNSRWSSIMP
jgi:hypothetical protein